MEFSDLDFDFVYNFYGAVNNRFKLDDSVFHVLEDEEDGWRSSMSEVKEVEDGIDDLFNFNHANIIATIQIKEISDPGIRGYRLVDTVSGHVWLEFGTDYSDDWYPCFIFRYMVDKTKKVKGDDVSEKKPERETVSCMTELSPELFNGSIDRVVDNLSKYVTDYDNGVLTMSMGKFYFSYTELESEEAYQERLRVWNERNTDLGLLNELAEKHGYILIEKGILGKDDTNSVLVSEVPWNLSLAKV